jgi:hypothetical protein
VLWNLGTASAELGKVESAIAYWKRYEDLAPEDWRVLPKLIQGYQANGDVQSRDREIRALYERRRLHLISDHGLQDAERFCREQFRLAKNTIFAFQYFYPSLQGRWRTHYRFSVFDRATGKEKSSISLVSDGPTLDEDRRPGRTRKYRIERLDGARCWTYTQFEVEPSYDSLRHAVVDILVGKTKPATAIPRRGAAQQGVERDGRYAPARQRQTVGQTHHH